LQRRRNAPRQREEARIDGRRTRKSGLPPPSFCCCCCRCGVLYQRVFLDANRRVVVLHGAALSLLSSCCREIHTCESDPAASCLRACIDLVGACWRDGPRVYPKRPQKN
ncbi:unnamed protein product, partial [Ectocarpus sp. 12 AP-2014]